MSELPSWFQSIDLKDQTPDMMIDQEAIYADHCFNEKNDGSEYAKNTTSWD